MENEITLGLGGQEVLPMGLFLSYGGMSENKNVVCLPVYDTEVFGRITNCSVTISESEIICPVVTFPEIVVVMDHASLEKFEPIVRSGGLLLINKFPGCRQPLRTDIKNYIISAEELSNQAGIPCSSNMVMLGALLQVTKIINMTRIHEYLVKTFKDKGSNEITLNMKAIEAGIKYMSSIKDDHHAVIA